MSKKEGEATSGSDKNSDYQSGFNAGKQDGWSGRDYSPPTADDRWYGNEDYLRGYNDGWKEGGNNPKPRGQLPSS